MVDAFKGIGGLIKSTKFAFKRKHSEAAKAAASQTRTQNDQDALLPICDKLLERFSSNALSDIMPKDFHNCGWAKEDLFAGKAVTQPFQRTTPLINAIVELEYFKDQKKWVEKHMTKNDMPTATAHVTQKSVITKLTKLVAEHVESTYCVADQKLLHQPLLQETMLQPHSAELQSSLLSMAPCRGFSFGFCF